MWIISKFKSILRQWLFIAPCRTGAALNMKLGWILRNKYISTVELASVLAYNHLIWASRGLKQLCIRMRYMFQLNSKIPVLIVFGRLTLFQLWPPAAAGWAAARRDGNPRWYGRHPGRPRWCRRPISSDIHSIYSQILRRVTGKLTHVLKNKKTTKN